MTRPRIFLDGYNLDLEQGTGVATYARTLSYRLGALGAEVGVLYGPRHPTPRDPLLREVRFFDARGEERRPIADLIKDIRRQLGVPFGATAREVPITGRVITRSFESRLPHFDRLFAYERLFGLALAGFNLWNLRMPVRLPHTPDIMHWTYPLPLKVPGARNIYTLHDLVPLRLPHTTLDVKRRYYRLCRLLVRQADHIVTVSESSRNDIISLLGADPAKVTNTWQAVDIPAKFAKKPEALARAEVEGSTGLSWGGYFLFYGAIEPKKNVGRLIEAFLAAESPHPLVLVGKQAWKSEQELRLLFEDTGRFISTEGGRFTVRRSVLRRRVILLDYAPFRLLVSLIRGARALLFPSLYEGFGLPALEAMSLGTPVLTSNTASLPEVVGDAAIQVDPYDVQAMAEAIRALDADAELRARLAAAGPRRAEEFSLERYDRRLAALYAKLGLSA
ncbi:MAG: glycosyltransferase family 4 protein, partial [Acetobacteraceae bacterium]|nr:glycosyltransferase family 4 protein [Acetobacteraceae bacterium]